MIYSPAEDSYLLQTELKKLCKDKSILDVGSGSGILAETALAFDCSSILALEIDDESLALLKKKKIPYIKSDLLRELDSNKRFDLIVFNPPYLPLDEKEDKESKLATTGGKKGDEIILRFLKQAKKHLTEEGKILLLTSSLTNQEGIDSLLTKLNLKSEIIAKKKIFFETLSVFKIQQPSNL